jgi:hypothetical protein
VHKHGTQPSETSDALKGYCHSNLYTRCCHLALSPVGSTPHDEIDRTVTVVSDGARCGPLQILRGSEIECMARAQRPRLGSDVCIESFACSGLYNDISGSEHRPLVRSPKTPFVNFTTSCIIIFNYPLSGGSRSPLRRGDCRASSSPVWRLSFLAQKIGFIINRLPPP